MAAVDELLADINIIRNNIEALHKEVAGLSTRAQAQGKHLSRAELDEVLAKVKAETRFQVYIPYEDVMSNLQRHLTTPAKVDAALGSGLQRLEQVINQIPRSIPIEGEVWGFTNWKAGALFVGTPLVLLLLLLWFPAVFSRVPKEQFERVQERAKLERERASRLWTTARQAADMNIFYAKQIKDYLKKNPKAASNFPKYVIPQKNQTP